MKNFRNLPVMLAAAALFAGCSTMPPANPQLEETRQDFQAAQANPDVVNLAPVQLKEASDALDTANNAWMHHDSDKKVNELAYVAKQKVAEQSVANAAKERDQMRLDQRTQEANKARMDASIAQNQTAAAQNEAADAQRKQQEAEAHAQQLESELSDLSAQKTERGIVVTFGDVLFNTDDARLKQSGLSNVQKLADILKQNPQRVVLIEGYTDNTGTPEHNQMLSERRALSVGTALTELGISRDRITTRGYGEAYPAARNDTAAGRQFNRRVEIVLSGDDGKIPPR
ncbi:flagellar motor protein MotB [Sulfuriferula sp. AH1]|uniref:OmpA family protein n=1 Tax=Sulfuriferula sp. AH1 TaxID=1985873 RepID=UPI000B3B3919|nr:OmpA family protein [Sulfuriferula sp. AH1]ARU31285.1 flagellar motor protein MotB [Sulfuriferula sp. AH1]